MGVNLDTVKKIHNTNESMEKIHTEILFSKRIIFAEYNGVTAQFMAMYKVLTIICIGIVTYIGYKCSNMPFMKEYNGSNPIYTFIGIIGIIGLAIIILSAVLRFIEQAAFKFYASNMLYYIYKHCAEMAKRYSVDQEEQTDLATYYFTLYDISDANIDHARAELSKIIHN